MAIQLRNVLGTNHHKRSELLSIVAHNLLGAYICVISIEQHWETSQL